MSILVAIATISILVLLHELGHFFLAKKFDVKVEEFGIGLPPRLFGKRIGETLYSLNVLLLGGFVRMEGEEGKSTGPRSFSQKPLYQRLLIVAGGVLVFWIIAAVILSILGVTSGIPMAISDEDTQIHNPHVQVIGIAKDSPAEISGMKAGDTIIQITDEKSNITAIGKVQEIQEIAERNQGTKLILTIARGSETLAIELTPRVDPPEGQGAIGVGLARTGFIRYQWYEAPLQGVILTGKITWTVLHTLASLVSTILSKEGVPAGVQLSGPVGVIGMLGSAFSIGPASFLYLIAVLSIYLAIFNILPIPALDGGRIFFLLIEGIRRKPLAEKLEQRLIMISFIILISFIIWVTIGDVRRLF